MWSWRALCGCALLAVVTYLGGAVQLHRPSQAHLVPRLRARLVELTVLVWLVGLALSAFDPAALSFSFGLNQLWLACCLAGMGLALAGYRLGGMVAASGIVGWTLFDYVPTHLPAYFPELLLPVMLAWGDDPFVGAVLAAAVPVLLALAARAMFAQAGERQWVLLERRGRLHARETTPFVWSGRRSAPWYRFVLRRDIARRRPQALSLHALGPGYQLAALATHLAAFAACLLCGFAFVGVLDLGLLRLVLDTFGWLLAALVMLPFLWQGDLVCNRVRRTAGEQALVRLAPLHPGSAGAFNRMLAAAQLRRGLQGWGMASGASLLLAILAGAGGAALWWQLCLCCLALPWVPLQMRNMVAKGEMAPGMSVVALILSGACVLAGWACARLFDAPLVPAAAAAAIVLALLLARLRWRLMLRGAFAFPAPGAA